MMLLEYDSSPIDAEYLPTSWAALTAALMASGRIPPLETWTEESGALKRIEEELCGIRDKHQRMNRRMREAPHAWIGKKWRCASKTWPPVPHLQGNRQDQQ